MNKVILIGLCLMHFEEFKTLTQIIIKKIAKEEKVKDQEIWKVLALCLWGRDHNYLPLIETMWMLGKKETIRRIKNVL